MQSLNNYTNELIYKTEIHSQTENKLMVTNVREREINQEFGLNKYIILHIKQINNKDIIYSTGNYIQYLAITYKGKESEREYIYIYKTE